MPKEQYSISKDGISFLGLVSIGLFSYIYSIFASDFAEVYFQPSFLNFPIFVGEFLLAFCALLFLMLTKMSGVIRERRYIILGAYVIWVLLMAFRGYYAFGPLAFRNAALFYYPLFAVFSYVFYSKKFFTHPYFLLLPFLLGGTLAAGVVNDYFWIGYIILFTITVLSFKGRGLKWICISFMIGVVLFNCHTIFGGSRSHLMGFIAAVVFIVIYMLVISVRFCLIYKVAGFMVMLAVLGLGVLKFSDRNAVKSIFVSVPLVEGFKELDAIIQDKKDDFNLCDLSVELYHDNRDGDKTVVEPVSDNNYDDNDVVVAPATIETRNETQWIDQIKAGYIQKIVTVSRQDIIQASEDMRKKVVLLAEESGEEYFRKVSTMLSRETKTTLSRVDANVKELKKEFVKDIQNSPELSSPQVNELKSFSDQEATRVVKNIEIEFEENKRNALEGVIKPGGQPEEQKVKPRDRSLGIAYGNMLFRLLIWRDMGKEILEKKALWGINWGKPQRSKSLEILRLAEVEWRRDGWITPHNSYFHIIYRAGVMGVFLIISFFVTLWRVIKDFARAKSIVGGLLIGIFIYWLTIANFLVFLEFPYNAIPFWSLFGLTLAYRDHVKEKALEKTTL